MIDEEQGFVERRQNVVDLHAIATMTAEATIEKAFLKLGTDITDKEQLASLKADFIHLNTWRLRVEAVSDRMAGLVTRGILYLIIIGGLTVMGINYKPVLQYLITL